MTLQSRSPRNIKQNTIIGRKELKKSIDQLFKQHDDSPAHRKPEATKMNETQRLFRPS